MSNIIDLKSPAKRRLTLLFAIVFLSGLLGMFAPVSAHAATDQLSALSGFNGTSVPATGESYMPVAAITVLLTALTLCAFGYALLRRSTHD